MTIRDEVLAANEDYAASFGPKADLALPPARHFAILTCMDARLDPAKYAGLSEGDAHVLSLIHILPRARPSRCALDLQSTSLCPPHRFSRARFPAR